ncbi:MAG: hypothetical protein IPN58_20400 [Anaerolineales bacterium]|nr:hypothetical protein [Anaerolineales bacterium]
MSGFAKSDGSIQSLIFNFDDKKLTIQPQVQTWPVEVPTQTDGSFQVKIIDTSGKTFEQINFTGNLSDGVLAGDLIWDEETIPVVFTQLASVDVSRLEKYVGVYRFDSGDIVSVLLCPSYDAGGLQFFPPGLMYTDFTSGDSRGLYPLDDSTFGIGSARVLAYPLENNRIQFVLNDSGQVTEL